MLSDAEAAGFRGLGEAAKRCRRCPDSTACIRWLKWRGNYGPAPVCPNAAYVAELRQHRGAAGCPSVERLRRKRVAAI